MDIDSRLEKLVERHEALTQSVELLTTDVRDMISEQRKFNTDQAELNGKWEKRFGQIAHTLEHLARIAENHEHRLDGMEDQAS